MRQTYNYNGINYLYPEVKLLSNTGIGSSEFAARTCYNSYDKSENEAIVNFDYSNLCNIQDSDLLKQLSFVHFHHSVLEHNVLSFFIKDISRGVLQELVRHRIASYSVKSTRYTLDDLLYLYVLDLLYYRDIFDFCNKALELDLFVTSDKDYNRLELENIYYKLKYQSNKMDLKDFLELIVPKSNIEDLLNSSNPNEMLDILKSKKKRNAGDSFKHIISDNFKTDLVLTINLRSLRNFFDLRLSGAAWFQIRNLAEKIKEATPESSKKLIFKEIK